MNRYEICVLISLIAIFIGWLMAVFIYPAIWTNKDAKERGLSAPLWTCAVIFLQNSGIISLGFILYLIIRVIIPKFRCPECGARCDKKSVYCSSCGKPIIYESVKPFSKKHNKYLYGILVGVILIILGSFGACLSSFLAIPEGKIDNSVGMINNHWGGSWSVSAISTNETLSRNFEYDENKPGTIEVTCSAKEGTVTLNVIGDNKSDVYVLTDFDDTLTIDLSEYTGNEVELVLINDNVSKLKFHAELTD